MPPSVPRMVAISKRSKSRRTSTLDAPSRRANTTPRPSGVIMGAEADRISHCPSRVRAGRSTKPSVASSPPETIHVVAAPRRAARSATTTTELRPRPVRPAGPTVVPGGATVETVEEGPSRNQESWSFASCALCRRSSGSFTRQALTSRSNSTGASAIRWDTGSGWWCRIDPIRLAWVAPANARSPVAISWSTQPSAHRSLRASASRPSSCSGAMYWKVPTIAPSRVSGWATVGEAATVRSLPPPTAALRASPKSMSLAPVRVIITLPGLRSRWTTPARWARSSASAICAP